MKRYAAYDPVWLKYSNAQWVSTFEAPPSLAAV